MKLPFHHNSGRVIILREIAPPRIELGFQPSQGCVISVLLRSVVYILYHTNLLHQEFLQNLWIFRFLKNLKVSYFYIHLILDYYFISSTIVISSHLSLYQCSYTQNPLYLPSSSNRRYFLVSL